MKFQNDCMTYSKKVVWITPDYFIDCDYNIEVLHNIASYYEIYWLLIFPLRNSRYNERDFKELEERGKIKVLYFYQRCRGRSPKMIRFYNDLFKVIQDINPDLIYLNDTPTNPYSLLFYERLKSKKTIVTAHDGSIKSSFKFSWLSRIVFNLAYTGINYVNTFSRTEERIFRSTFRNVKTFFVPLGLKSFGCSILPKRNDNIIFFFFGSINKNKNLALFIDAACNLHEQGLQGFKISISGSCNDWQTYKKRLKYPELFECEIRFHHNSEIPDIVARNHYMVFPYKEMSQSGALKVAFNYNIPVIVSDLEGFTSEVTNGFNGFVFKSDNVSDLERVMKERLTLHHSDYQTLQQNIAHYNSVTYAPRILAKQYLDMFHTVHSIPNL